MEKCAFITLTNTGYIDYTLNCLESLKKIKSNLNLIVYCIGKKGHDMLISKGYSSILIDDDNNSNFQTFRSGNWSNITHNKFVIIYENLLKYDYVCFTDGDIIYENNDFYKHLFDNINDNDMLIQNDICNTTNLLCSGFMFIKSNLTTLSFFNPINTEMFKNNIGWDDQIYVNDNKNKIKYEFLSSDLFPNGWYYYNNTNLNPYIIHFNWIIGHEKKERMKIYNKWLL